LHLDIDAILSRYDDETIVAMRSIREELRAEAETIDVEAWLRAIDGADPVVPATNWKGR